MRLFIYSCIRTVMLCISQGRVRWSRVFGSIDVRYFLNWSRKECPRPSGLGIVLLLCAVVFIEPAMAADAVDTINGARPVQQASTTAFLVQSLLFFMIAFLAYFILVIKPEQTRKEDHEKFVGGLKKTDEVVTSGGILAKVHAVKDTYVVIEVAQNVRLRVQSKHVHQLPPIVSKTK